MPNIRVMHFGLGPIGAAIVKQVAQRPGFKIVGGIDNDPAMEGRDLGDVVGFKKRLGVIVSGDAKKAMKAARPDVVVLCTSSSIKKVLPQIEAILKTRTPIVSTTEELSYPGYTHIRQARQIHEWAKKAKVAVLGTGVNPGFAMDALPLFATAVCNSVRSVRCERIQDASTRRVPFQRKIGAGLDPATFAQRAADGSLRHVGLGESLHLIAQTLGIALDDWHETLEPVLAARPLECALGKIPAGHAAGVRQVAEGLAGGEPRIVLEFQAAIGQRDAHERIVIDGDPPLDLLIQGGVHGDTATSAIVINALEPLLASPPGLHTMASIPLVACRAAPLFAAARA